MNKFTDFAGDKKYGAEGSSEKSAFSWERDKIIMGIVGGLILVTGEFGWVRSLEMKRLYADSD